MHIWELSSAKEYRTITIKERGQDNGCDHLAIAPDCRTIVTLSQRGTLRFWDMLTGEEVMPCMNVPVAVRSLAFSPDSKLLATGHVDSTILLWDLSSIAARFRSQINHAKPQ